MDINSLQGSAAYAKISGSTPPVDNTASRNQNIEAANSTLDAQITARAQQAFEVNITEEARERLARENQEPVRETETLPETEDTSVQAAPASLPPAEDNTQQEPPVQQPVSQIVNIVA